MRGVEILSIGNKPDLKFKGKFFVFEGPHASGKTTQAKMLHEILRKSGIESTYSKEPYHRDFISLIEKYSEGDIVNSPILMNLLAADRYLHTQDIIKWLKGGMNVISDRYVMSSFVYQQIQQIPLSTIKLINNYLIKPDYTFYLEVPIKVRISRLKKSHSRENHFFLIENNIIKEQSLYEMIVKEWDSVTYGTLVKIDGTKSIHQINSKLYNFLLEIIR